MDYIYEKQIMLGHSLQIFVFNSSNKTQAKKRKGVQATILVTSF